jgi:tRNA threonylcarbamoyl adenosine modification protein YjeE
MRAADPDTLHRSRRLPSVDATTRLAELLSEHVRRGDFIGLAGTLGVGKTTFARAFINAIARRGGAPEEEVPSPTFTLVQSYELPGLIVSHFDLYRIERPDEIHELGLDDAIADGAVLIEWPERLESFLPSDRLELILSAGANPDERIAELIGYGEWAERLAGIPDNDRA